MEKKVTGKMAYTKNKSKSETKKKRVESQAKREAEELLRSDREGDLVDDSGINMDSRERKRLAKARAEEANKSRAKEREEDEESIKKLKRRGKKHKNQEGSTPRFGMEELPYYFTPSFMHHNGRVAAALEMYVRPGSNRNLTYSQVIDMIPVNSLDGVDMHLVINDSLIKHDEKKRIIRQNAEGGKETIEDTQATGTKQDRKNESTRAAQKADVEDYVDYEMILDSADPVVVFKINLIIVGDTEDLVDEQIEILNTLMDQRHEGARWDSLGGDQLNRFTKMFERLPHDRFSMTSTGANYSGLNFSVNAGLNDPKGLPIGIDALSLAASTSFFDMHGSTDKQALIAIPRSSNMARYSRPDAHRQPSSASIMAQCVANHFSLNRKRVHHVVINDFDYFENGLYYRPRETADLFETFDVSHMTINPLQGFGAIESVVPIYGRLIQKIVNIFDVMNNLKLTQEERAVILDIVDRFYFNQNLWISDAELYPKRTRIVGIKNPETYPTMGTLINEFTTLATRASRDNRELKADRIDTLGAILRQSITANMGILGRPTSITESNAPQVYYSFKSIESAQIRQIQFLNLIDYIIYTASEGDLIVIHGADELWKRVLDMVAESIQAAQDRGVKFLFTFDSVASQASQVDKWADIFTMQGSYYTDLDSDVDWSIVGKSLPEEVQMFEKALNSNLSPTIRSQMMAKSGSQVLIHRHMGDVNNFVHLNVLV